MTRMVRNGTVVTSMPGVSPGGPVIISRGAVVFDGERIVAIGEESDLKGMHGGAEEIDARGGIIMPGLVNLHHHFYSALARGLNPGAPMNSFSDVLDTLWWRLDRALDKETVEISAHLSLLDCIRWGCTTVFDHHASPSFIDGSLDLIGSAVAEVGLSAALCYEVTDRNGVEEAARGIAENRRFIEACRQQPRLKGLVGLHASFTVSDQTMSNVAATYSGEGCHIHVAEDPVDVSASLVAFGKGPVERLHDFGILDEKSLLAHGIHLPDGAYERIAESGASIIHNPESNANNGVGRLDVPEVAARGVQVCLGTDGMSSSVLKALRFAYLMHRASTGDANSGFEHLPNLLGNNVLVARRFFEEPLLGELVEDAPADLIVLDGSEITPLDEQNLFAYLAYGVSEARVSHTIARGKTVLENYQPTTVDVEALSARARTASPDLWRRFHELDTGTGFLGSPGKSK